MLVAAVSIVAAAPTARALDMSQLTCRAFFAAGHDNIAAMIMWLRGYHAGRTGSAIVADRTAMVNYGTRLGS